jgi:hypothetical protein
MRAPVPAHLRALDVAAILAFVLLVGAQLWRLGGPALDHPGLSALAVVLGYLFADFVSGLVHWAADTWGSSRTPVVGNAFLRPFREHHLDPAAITRHDFAETNGNNCLVCVPVAAAALFVPVDGALLFFPMAFLACAMLWVMATNTFHKWSHLPAPPPVVRWLQRLNLVLSPEHHARHHAAPHASHYCITSGLLNRPLDRLGFFVRLEALVTRLTGAVARAEEAPVGTGGLSGGEASDRWERGGAGLLG